MSTFATSNWYRRKIIRETLSAKIIHDTDVQVSRETFVQNYASDINKRAFKETLGALVFDEIDVSISERYWYNNLIHCHFEDVDLKHFWFGDEILSAQTSPTTVWFWCQRSNDISSSNSPPTSWFRVSVRVIFLASRSSPRIFWFQRFAMAHTISVADFAMSTKFVFEYRRQNQTVHGASDWINISRELWSHNKFVRNGFVESKCCPGASVKTKLLIEGFNLLLWSRI